MLRKESPTPSASFQRAPRLTGKDSSNSKRVPSKAWCQFSLSAWSSGLPAAISSMGTFRRLPPGSAWVYQPLSLRLLFTSCLFLNPMSSSGKTTGTQNPKRSGRPTPEWSASSSLSRAVLSCWTSEWKTSSLTKQNSKPQSNKKDLTLTRPKLLCLFKMKAKLTWGITSPAKCSIIKFDESQGGSLEIWT